MCLVHVGDGKAQIESGDGIHDRRSLVGGDDHRGPVDLGRDAALEGMAQDGDAQAVLAVVTRPDRQQLLDDSAHPHGPSSSWDQKRPAHLAQRARRRSGCFRTNRATARHCQSVRAVKKLWSIAAA